MLPIMKGIFHLSSKKFFLFLKLLPNMEIRNNIAETKNAEGNRNKPIQKIIK